MPLPLPTGFTVTVKLGGGGAATKLAPIDSDKVIVKVQKPVVSLAHFDASGAFATFQLLKANPLAGDAIRLTGPPTGNGAEHWAKVVVESHEMPKGELETIPLPGALTETFRVTGAAIVPDKL